MRVNCPECDHRIRVPDDDEDRRIKCPQCGEKFRPSELEDDEDEEPTPRRKGGKGRGSAKQDNSKLILLLGVVGGVGLLFVVGVVGVIVWLNMDNPKVAKGTGYSGPPMRPATPPAPTTSRFRPDQPIPDPGPQPPVFPPPVDTPVRPPVGNPNFPQPNPFPPQPNPFPSRPNPQLPTTNAALDDLFREPVDKMPPITKVAVLSRKPDDAPLTVPTFHSLMVANKLVKPSAQTKLTLDEVKAATVYIKVDAGELSGSGSGFYIGAENGAALVATNHHVIEAAAKRPAPGAAAKSKITCVFHSGVPGDERPTTAKIVAFDPIADLAVLRLDNPPAKLPKPINPWATPKLTETMEVRICGFPFGEQLATATTNPNISVNTGSVSSLRMKKAGGLDTVQISGAINPGNSGGPIVDKDGRLVGVAVATIKGSGLGFAVPVDELIGLLEGKILLTEFVPTGLDRTAARFKVVVPVMDPRTKVKTVYVRYWAGKGAKPRAVKDAQYGHKPIDNAQDLVLNLPDVSTSLAVAVGDLTLPADATEVVLQLGSEQMPAPGQPRGLLSISAPVEYKLNVKDLSNGSDAKPLREVFRDPPALAGQTVVVRARVVRPPTGTKAHEELVLSDGNGLVPGGLKFLAARDVAVQFDEVDADLRGNYVRAVCVVGQKGSDGLVPVRVARCDFLDDGETVVRSIPEADTKDQLAAANRSPKLMADKPITFKAVSVPLTLRAVPSEDLLVMFDGLGRPRNLSFRMTPDLAKKVAAAQFKPNGLYKVRLTGRVGTPPPEGRTTVTVARIEILDPNDDSVQKVIE